MPGGTLGWAPVPALSSVPQAPHSLGLGMARCGQDRAGHLFCTATMASPSLVRFGTFPSRWVMRLSPHRDTGSESVLVASL